MLLGIRISFDVVARVGVFFKLLIKCMNFTVLADGDTVVFRSLPLASNSWAELNNFVGFLRVELCDAFRADELCDELRDKLRDAFRDELCDTFCNDGLRDGFCWISAEGDIDCDLDDDSISP